MRLFRCRVLQVKAAVTIEVEAHDCLEAQAKALEEAKSGRREFQPLDKSFMALVEPAGQSTPKATR